MERRKFLSLMSLGTVGVAAPSIANATKMPIKSDPSKDGPICIETLQIQSGVKKNIKKPDNGITFLTDEYKEYKKVAMAVGKDGNLWLKTEDGQWKRIVTE